MKTETRYGPQFTASKFESALIKKIAQRADKSAAEIGTEYNVVTAMMDVEACHCNGMPLDLQKLLDADETTFCHDVFGIRRYIDRRDGKITDCFVPRCSLPERP